MTRSRTPVTPTAWAQWAQQNTCCSFCTPCPRMRVPQLTHTCAINGAAHSIESKTKRSPEAVVTSNGKAMTELIDAARDRMGRAIFATWDQQDIDDLVRLMRKLADAVKDHPPDR